MEQRFGVSEAAHSPVARVFLPLASVRLHGGKVNAGETLQAVLDVYEGKTADFLSK